MGAGTEQLEGERGVALLVETVVVEDVWGSDDDGVAVPGGCGDAQQGGEAVAGVADIGAAGAGAVADAAGVGAARAAGGGQVAVGESVESKLIAGSAVTPGARVPREGESGAIRIVRPPEFLVAARRLDC